VRSEVVNNSAAQNQRKGFQVKTIERKKIAQGKVRIERRLGREAELSFTDPVIEGGNIVYEVSDKTKGIVHGGIGTFSQLIRKVGLAEAINRRLHLLKLHLPYHESDHVLSMALNTLCGGDCLDDIERQRTDAVFLDAIGAERIPDPTTSGDFLRRFEGEDVMDLMDAIDDSRLKVWRLQPPEFFDEAIIDVDGTMVETTGECKQGMDINYKGEWGYHPLLVSLANTGEELRLLNRPGSRPSHEDADIFLDEAIALVRRAGFRKILLRGDTDFTQTRKLDEWNAVPNLRFVFGIDAMPNLVNIAENLPFDAWKSLQRRTKRPRIGPARARPDNVKEAIVVEREFDNIKLKSEEVAEFAYRPGHCKTTYRVVVVKKNLSIEKGETILFEHQVRYFFYLTNDSQSAVEEIVFLANDRCNQENLIAQLQNGVYALKAPVNSENANWAYMVCTALAWNLKAWWALCLPDGTGRWKKRHAAEKRKVLRMEFKRFAHAFIRIPCQIVKTGRKIIYRILGWNPLLHIFYRAARVLRE
jgi:hypothetical protein